MSQLAEDMSYTAANAAPAQGSGRDLEFGRIVKSICELAVGLFEAPMAMIKLYEGSQLVVKGTVGFASEAMLDDLSFCQRKLIPGESLILSDATADARYFLESAVLSGPKIRFYADIPLVSDGVVLGVLAMCERTPRHDFTGNKLNLFRQFANNSATTIALAQKTLERNTLATEIKSQQSRFDLAQEMTGIGYWSIDLKTRDITWSRGLYAVYGLTPKSYKPRVATQLDIYEEQDRAVIIERFQRAVNYGEDFDFTVEILRRKDKVTRTIRTKGGVEYGDDGKPLRLCACVRDITEGANDAEELIRARLAAEDINDAKNAFLEQITNELKTPLTNILGYARLINEQRHENPDIASYTQNLMKSAKALQSVVKDTLEVSTLDTPSVRETSHAHTSEEATNIVSLVRDVVNQFGAQAQINQTRLNAHFVDFDNSWAQMDSMRVRQILQNLLSNACKFTKGGLINVTASQVVVDNAQWLRISVRDTGIGMADEQALSLFSGNAEDINGNRVSGGGLGLSIAKAIVDLLGGHIGVVSRIGEGSNFWFEIPVKWVDAPAKARTADVVQAPMARTVNRVPGNDPMRDAPRSQAPVQRPVTVDEDRINREYLRALLQDMKLDIG